MKTPSLALLLLLSASAFANPNAPKALHCTAKQTPIDTQTGAPQTPTNLLPDFEVKFEADTSQPNSPMMIAHWDAILTTANGHEILLGVSVNATPGNRLNSVNASIIDGTTKTASHTFFTVSSSEDLSAMSVLLVVDATLASTGPGQPKFVSVELYCSNL